MNECIGIVVDNREVKFHDEYEYEYEWTKEIKLCEHLESQNVCQKNNF